MRALPFVVFLALGCSVQDADFDGFTSDVDCDDNDNRVFPGGNEICDGIDNDCSGTLDDPYAAGGTVHYVDADGDGFGATSATVVACEAPAGFVSNVGDCDDADPSVHPTALELCDLTDQDCDGDIDEDAVDAPTWHADWDQDGFGSSTLRVRACEAPTGYITDSTDCNDFSGDVNPAAPERCDLIDNNCDSVVDEPTALDARDFYRDADGDGYGDAKEPLRACFLPDGFAAADTDCNDASALQAPGLPEICRDGLDNNCNELPDQCTVSAWGDVSDAVMSWKGSGSRGYLGADVKIVGDVNGDGFDDMVGGAWYETVGGSFASGRAWLVYGQEFEPNPTGVTLSSEPSIDGAARFGYLGRAVSGIGDFDGDGFDDVVIGAYGENSRRGEAYVLYGSPEVRGGATRASDLPSLSGTVSSGELGLSVTGGFDMDGDGLSDMALGAQGESSRRGAVYLVYGGSDRLVGDSNIGDVADAVITGPGSSAFLGGESTMGAGGDFDGDGQQDLILGAWRATGVTSWSGAAYVLYGDTSRLSGEMAAADLDDRVLGESFFEYLGSGNGSVGDINGDGYDDMGIGCYGCSSYAGNLKIFLGDSTRIGEKVGSDADITLVGDSRSYLGQYAPVGGDFDGDGVDDVAVGAHFASPGGNTYQGVVYVKRGGPDLAGEYEASDGALDAVIEGPVGRFLYFGRGLGAGDVTGDGITDLLIGAERADSGAGRMYLFEGTSL